MFGSRVNITSVNLYTVCIIIKVLSADCNLKTSNNLSEGI